MDGALAELAAYFRRWCEPPDAELVRLAAAARAAGSRRDAIAAACDERDDPDPAAVAHHVPRMGPVWPPEWPRGLFDRFELFL